jgi:F-type H+-transporting ATPase subunit gamma
MSGKLKEVRERISSVNKTQQITKAMKMVAAARLRKAQQAIQQMRPYADKQQQMLVNILSNLEGDVETNFGEVRELNKVCLVVVTSSRGLCGAFNTNIIKATRAKLEGQYAGAFESGNVTILPIGKKGYDFFRKNFAEKVTINSEYVALFNDLTFDNVARASKYLMQSFEAGNFDAIDIVYGHFRNVVTQIPSVEQFLPVAKIETDETNKLAKADYIFEPDKASLLAYLIPSILQTQFYKCVLDTNASEHGARMTAMDNATTNAEELIKDLKVSYNKARQEAITREISEIVGGAAALADA